MSILKNLTTDSSIKGETDSLGSGGLWESGTYPLTIKVAYLSTAASGALALNIVAASGEKEIKQQFWITRRMVRSTIFPASSLLIAWLS